jgi:hypothetical protein
MDAIPGSGYPIPGDTAADAPTSSNNDFSKFTTEITIDVHGRSCALAGRRRRGPGRLPMSKFSDPTAIPKIGYCHSAELSQSPGEIPVSAAAMCLRAD